MNTQSYPVVGMTCGHCARAVTTELTALPGVTDVTVDVATGLATVASERPLDEPAVRAAVEEAGYRLAAR